MDEVNRFCHQEQKELFYQYLYNAVHSVPRDDNLLLRDDFGAHEGKDSSPGQVLSDLMGLARKIQTANYLFTAVVL